MLHTISVLRYPRPGHPKQHYCAAGVRLDGFLAESEGLSGNLDLRHFATNYQVSSVKSGSGQSPDRAQICSFVDVLFNTFFSEPVSGPPKWNFK